MSAAADRTAAWDGSTGPPSLRSLHAFGGAVEVHPDFDGVTIATAGRVGWWWGTERQADGDFSRYGINDARRISGAEVAGCSAF